MRRICAHLELLGLPHDSNSNISSQNFLNQFSYFQDVRINLFREPKTEIVLSLAESIKNISDIPYLSNVNTRVVVSLMVISRQAGRCCR